MKKYGKFVMLFVFALILTACVAVPAVNPPTAIGQTLVSAPPELTDLIAILLTAGVAWLLLKTGLGGQYTQPIVAILAPIIITAIEAFLQTIPPAFDNIALTVIHLLVLLVGSVGTLILARRAQTPKTLLAG